MVNLCCSYYSSHNSFAIHANNFAKSLDRYESVALISWKRIRKKKEIDPQTKQMLKNAKTDISGNIGIGLGFLKDMRKIIGKHRIAYVMWESTKIPDVYLSLIKDADAIWTPTYFVKNILVNNRVKEDKIYIVQGGVDTDFFRPGKPKKTERFRFLCVGKWETRKGILDLIKTYLSEFRHKEPVELVLHCFNPFIDFLVDIKKVINKAISSLSSGEKRSLPKISISKPVPLSQMPDLYNQCNAFVLPTKGEGWGLPISEAMSCGLPVIVTNYGGQTDFVTEDNGYLINVKKFIEVLDPVTDFIPFFDNGKLAQPDLEHLRYLMRYVYDHQEQAKEKGMIARHDMQSKWTWEHSARRAFKYVKSFS